jgi:hypothetical protein
MARFSDINRADELQAAATKLRQWRALDTAAKRQAYAASTTEFKRINRASTIAYIQPFGVNKLFYETKALAFSADTPAPTTKEENDTTLVGNITGALWAKSIFATIPTGAGNMSVPAKKVKFAKVRVTEQGTGKKNNHTSRFTGRTYTKHETNTLSCPYGKGTSADFASEEKAQAVLRAALKAPKRTISFSAQGDIQVQQAATT